MRRNFQRVKIQNYVWITTSLKPLNSFPTEIEAEIAILYKE